MQAGSVLRIEMGIDRAASALFALAGGYFAFHWFSVGFTQQVARLETVVTSVVAYLLSAQILAAIRPEARKLPVPIFDVRDVEPIEEPELLLTERFEPPASEDTLILDDILAKLGSDSRVVRLFDPAAMPTAGELKSRIDRHLDQEASAAQTSDAAQALHDALAELRRSIR